MPTQITIPVRIDADLNDSLRAESEKTGAPVAEIVRRACRAWLAKNGKKKSV